MLYITPGERCPKNMMSAHQPDEHSLKCLSRSLICKKRVCCRATFVETVNW